MDRGYDTRSPIQKTSSLPRVFALFRAYIIVVGIILVASVFFTFAYTPLFQIRTIEVSGAQMTPNESIQIYVSKVLEGNWRTVIPFNTTVGIPSQTLEANIMYTFPSTESVIVDRVGISRVRISVTEKVPVFAYCKKDTCALVDDKGVVFTFSGRSSYEIVEGSPAQFARRGVSTTDDIVALGKELLPEENRIALNKVRIFLRLNNFTVTKIHLEPLGFFDVFATSGTTNSDIEFRFRGNKKIDQQLEELSLALEKGLRQKIENNLVEYVISYVPQKVIYKNTGIQN